ncbi:MAG: helix-turn-helix domain-containing protein [Alphaproteobacteria bacterium]
MTEKACRNPHPLIRKLFYTRKGEGISQKDLARVAGLNKDAILTWERGKASPNLINFEACLNALGYDLVIIKRIEREKSQSRL